MTALFFFSCSYFSPWIFYISLFNWLEENKAEKQEPKVNIWNAVAWKNLFLVFYEVAKGFMSWYVECDEYMHCWLKEEFCLRSKSSLCFMDNVPLSPQCAKCVTPLSLGTMFPMLRDCRACGRAVFRMPLLSQLRAQGPILSLELVHLLLVASGHWVQLYLLSKDGSFLRHVRKDHPDRKSVTCCFSLR